MSGIWVPVVGIIGTSAVFIAFFLFRYQAKKDVQKTIRQSIDKGTELTPELVEKLGLAPLPRVNDLRRGVVLVAIGLAAIVAGMMNRDIEGIEAFGMFPLFVGLGFLLVWKMNKYE